MERILAATVTSPPEGGWTGRIRAGEARNPLGIGGIKKGEVRNPGGPKAKNMLTRAIQRILKKKGPDGVRNEHMVALTLMDMVRERDQWAMEFLFDRIEGKIATKQESSVAMTGADGGPLSVIMDGYIQDSVITDDISRQLAHAMLARLVQASAMPVALPVAPAPVTEEPSDVA